MKKVTLLLLAVIWVLSSFSQESNFGIPTKQGKRIYSKVIGQNSQFIFSVVTSDPIINTVDQVQYDGVKFSIQALNYSLQQEWITEIELPFVNAQLEHVISTDSVVKVFFSTTENVENKNQLFVLDIDGKKGVVGSSSTMVAEMDFEKRRYKGEFFIQRSLNSQNYVILSARTDAEGMQVFMNYKLCSMNHDVLYDISQTIPQPEKYFFIKQLHLDNLGYAYVLAYVRPEERRLGGQQVFLYKTNPYKLSIDELNLSVEKAGLCDFLMSSDANKRILVIGGLYSESFSPNSASGTFLMHVSPDSNKIILKTQQSFKAKFLNEFNSSGINRANELLNYKLRNIILRSDGGAILAAESELITESSQYNSYYQVYTTSYTYHFDNVFIISISKDGSVSWENILRKNQTSENDEGFYSGYTYLIDNENIHFIYNKSIRKRSLLNCFTVNNKGEALDKTLFRENDDVFIFPKGAKQVSFNEIIFPCLQKGKTNYLKLTF